MELPKKKFKKGDMVCMSEEALNWNSYMSGSFRVVSYKLFIHLGDGSTDIIHESNLKYLDIDNNITKHWRLIFRNKETGKYYEYWESHMVIDVKETRNNKIKKLID